MRADTIIPAAALAALATLCAWAGAAPNPAKPEPEPEVLKPFSIVFKGADKEMPLLAGEPQTKGYRSGLVVLEKAESMHEHSTGRYEEALIILEGAGTAKLTGHPDIAFRAGTLIYIPPDTRHSIINTGKGQLRYIYLVAPTRNASPK